MYMLSCMICLPLKIGLSIGFTLFTSIIYKRKRAWPHVRDASFAGSVVLYNGLSPGEGSHSAD